MWRGFFDDDDVSHPGRTLVVNEELRKLLPDEGRALFFRDSVKVARVPSTREIDPFCADVMPWSRQEYVSFFVRE